MNWPLCWYSDFQKIQFENFELKNAIRKAREELSRSYQALEDCQSEISKTIGYIDSIVR